MNVNLNELEEGRSLKQASLHTLSRNSVEANCSVSRYPLLRVAWCCEGSTSAFSSAARTTCWNTTLLMCLETAQNAAFTLSTYTVCLAQVKYCYKGCVVSAAWKCSRLRGLHHYVLS